MKIRPAIALLLAGTALLAGCKREGELVIEQGVGITALRSVCPAVGVPDFLGDVTLFSQPGVETVDAIDVTASITNVRSTCNDQGENVYTEASFDVVAQRRDPRGARSVELPYFSTVMRGGDSVIAKRVGTVQVNFADGEIRATGSGKAGSFVNRSAATLPADIRRRITEKRRPGESTAAIDPLTEPDVVAAIKAATFELLVGFQLTDDQLRFNAQK